jgi:hypothetical protein
VAEDHADSRQNATAIYNCIREPLISNKVPSDRKLPLVYVVDSFLKNVKGKFTSIIEPDVKNWMPSVYQSLNETQQQKLKKVWNLWKGTVGFTDSNWREMGQCFESSNGGGSGLGGKLDKAGITVAVRPFATAFFCRSEEKYDVGLMAISNHAFNYTYISLFYFDFRKMEVLF